MVSSSAKSLKNEARLKMLLDGCVYVYVLTNVLSFSGLVTEGLHVSEFHLPVAQSNLAPEILRILFYKTWIGFVEAILISNCLVFNISNGKDTAYSIIGSYFEFDSVLAKRRL